MLINFKFNCSHCKKETSSLELSTITNMEFECSHCGEWGYWKKPREALAKATKAPSSNKKDKTQASPFSKGMKVRKSIYFQGKLSEYDIQKVHSISKGVIYLSDSEGRKETGITYDLQGNENECYFPGFASKIKVIKPKKK